MFLMRGLISSGLFGIRVCLAHCFLWGGLIRLMGLVGLIGEMSGSLVKCLGSLVLFGDSCYRLFIT